MCCKHFFLFFTGKCNFLPFENELYMRALRRDRIVRTTQVSAPIDLKGSDRMRDTAETENAVRLYSGTVYGVALAHTGSKSDADDVFQETFLAFHCSSKTFNDSEHIKAWLIRTAVNMSRRIVCGKHRRTAVLDENIPSERFEFATDEQNDIADAVRKLPEKYRAAIWLHYFEDMPAKQVAKVLGERESTVRSQLMRGRERLKEILGKDWFDE